MAKATKGLTSKGRKANPGTSGVQPKRPAQGTKRGNVANGAKRGNTANGSTK